MPFVTDGQLEDMLDPEAGLRAAERIADRGGDELLKRTRRLTPVDRSPDRDRSRPHLRDTIERTDVEHAGALANGFRYRVLVRTFDPVGPLVEWTTKPHVIRPRRERGPNAALRFRGKGGWVFAREVHHPGTRGAHMFSVGAAETQAEVQRIAGPAVRQFARDLVRGRRVTFRG